jgi:hypothetical protein
MNKLGAGVQALVVKQKGGNAFDFAAAAVANQCSAFQYIYYTYVCVCVLYRSSRNVLQGVSAGVLEESIIAHTHSPAPPVGQSKSQNPFV